MPHKITEISLTAVAKTSTLSEPRSPTHARASHVLLIDLSASEMIKSRKNPNVYNNPPKEKPLKEGGSLVNRLKTLVKEDLAAPEEERIDMVVVRPTTAEEGPKNKTWKAMDGLRPRHLEVSAGKMEEGSIKWLDKLETPWPLETLTVTGMAYDDDFFPRITIPLRSLTMNFCHGTDFRPGAPPPWASPSEGEFEEGTGATNLEEFTLTNMDGQNVFVKTFDANPLMKNTLRHLKLYSVDGFDSGPLDFRLRLTQCVNLRSVDLAFADDGYAVDGGSTYSFAEIPESLPRSVEEVKFQGPASGKMLQELAGWIRHAKNDTWLPNLKRIAFSTHIQWRNDKPKEELVAKLEAGKEELFDVLRARSPGVEVLDRKPEELTNQRGQ